MGKKELIVLIGLPASGKSTYIKNILRPKHPEMVVWSRDDIVDIVAKEHKITYTQAYNKYQTIIEDRYKKTLSSYRHSLPDVIVCDKTNLSSKHRDKEFKFFKDKKYFITYVFFEFPKTPEEISAWKRRLNSRPGKIIPEFVLEDMMNKGVMFVPKEANVKPDMIYIINNWKSEKDNL